VLFNSADRSADGLLCFAQHEFAVALSLCGKQQELLVLATGVGVGVASMVGTLKFLTSVGIKPFIAGSLLPTVGLAAATCSGKQGLAFVRCATMQGDCCVWLTAFCCGMALLHSVV
jgi:hypothetical protein